MSVSGAAFSNSVQVVTTSDERLIFADTAARFTKNQDRNCKLFVSGIVSPDQRVGFDGFQNRAELRDAFAALGFIAVKPEALPIEDRIDLFASATCIVSLGGAAIANAAFCAPQTEVAVLVPPGAEIGAPAQLLSSLDLRYGIVFGSANPSDAALNPNEWTIDTERTCAILKEHFRAMAG